VYFRHKLSGHWKNIYPCVIIQTRSIQILTLRGKKFQVQYLKLNLNGEYGTWKHKNYKTLYTGLLSHPTVCCAELSGIKQHGYHSVVGIPSWFHSLFLNIRISRRLCFLYLLEYQHSTQVFWIFLTCLDYDTGLRLSELCLLEQVLGRTQYCCTMVSVLRLQQTCWSLPVYYQLNNKCLQNYSCRKFLSS
jgi:hypothetical protein